MIENDGNAAGGATTALVVGASPECTGVIDAAGLDGT
jgi:hypothetical protein